MTGLPPHPACLEHNRRIEARFPGRFAADVLDAYFDAALCNDPLHLLDDRHANTLCRGEPAGALAGCECTTLTTLRSYCKENLDGAEPTRDRRIEVRREMESNPAALATRHRNSLRGKRLMVWLTPVDRLVNSIEGKACRASSGRDLLGLIHYEKDSELVMFRIPSNRVGDVRIPTFVDGADNAVFCMWLCSINCGFTWRLDTQSQGLEEGVAAPIELRPDILPSFLGEVREEVCAPDVDRLLSREGGCP